MLTIEVTTPERKLLAEQADSISLPTETGEITILPGHAPLVGALRAGMATLRQAGKESYLAIAGGFVEIRGDGTVSVLADTADRAEELDLSKVEAARERAAQALANRKAGDDVSAAMAMAALEREVARIRVAKHHHTKRGISLPS